MSDDPFDELFRQGNTFINCIIGPSSNPSTDRRIIIDGVPCIACAVCDGTGLWDVDWQPVGTWTRPVPEFCDPCHACNGARGFPIDGH